MQGELMPFEEDSGDFLSGAGITYRTLGSQPARGSAGPGTRHPRTKLDRLPKHRGSPGQRFTLQLLLLDSLEERAYIPRPSRRECPWTNNWNFYRERWTC